MNSHSFYIRKDNRLNVFLLQNNSQFTTHFFDNS